uniref:Complement component 1 Q subcomponent-binding protein, mitochondrial n=1 Tax=Neogobius melanostomus TaxID=47308 RepID=A0A8C6TTM0_9GOBI
CEVMFKSVVRAVGSAVRLSSATASSSLRAAPLSCPVLSAQNSATARPFTRSLWMLSNSGASSGYRPKLFGSKALTPSVSCGCGGLHTEGDKAFGDFLTDELKEERKIQKNKALPKMSGGWELEMNGTEAKLVRLVTGDKVTVTFNINNSVPPNFAEEMEQGQNRSTPNFVVEVMKQGAKHSLVFDCNFPEDEVNHGEGGGEEESDIFAIREVSFQPEGDEDWKETSYTLNTDALDWVCLRFIYFLTLMELSTAIEHQEYIKFLENLQKFVKCT